MRSRHALPSVVAVMCTLVLAACGTGSSSPSQTTPLETSQATPAPSIVSSAAPSPGAPSGGAFKVGPLTAGTYTVSAMTPAITVTMPGGFSVRHVKADEVRLTLGPEIDDPELVIGTAQEHDIVTTLATAVNLKVGAPGEVSVNGRQAKAIDVESVGTSEQHIFGTTNSVYPLLPGWKARLVELDLNGSSFVIYLAAPAAEFAGAAGSLDAIVASLKF